MELEHESEVSGVTPIVGEFWRFHIRSRTRADLHLVDLEAYNFNGECSCEHFRFKLCRMLDDGAKPSESRRCDHIKRARAYMTEILFPLVAKNLKAIVHPLEMSEPY